MKKLFIAAVILMATTVQMVAGPIVSINFQIGRKSLDCAKFGICNAGVDVTWKLSSMQYDETNHILLVNVHKEFISGKEEFFTGQTVLFEEAVTLSPEIQKALGSRVQLTIPVGKHKLTKTRSGFQIQIALK